MLSIKIDCGLMKYDELLIKAHKFEKEISPNFKNINELIRNDFKLIEVLRICLGETQESFEQHTEVSKEELKKAKKGKELSERDIRNILTYVKKKLEKSKELSIVESLSRNYVFLDNMDNVKNWIKYDRLSQFFRKNVFIWIYSVFFIFIFGISLLGSVLEAKIDIHGVIGIFFVIMTILFLIFLAKVFLNSPPNHHEIRLFTLAAAFNQDIDINSLKKYVECISKTLRIPPNEKKTYFLYQNWYIEELCDKTSDIIHNQLISKIEEKNFELLSSIFKNIGSIFSDLRPRNLQLLNKILMDISENKKEYPYKPYSSPSPIESFKSFIRLHLFLGGLIEILKPVPMLLIASAIVTFFIYIISYIILPDFEFNIITIFVLIFAAISTLYTRQRK